MKRIKHISIGIAPDQTLASTSIRLLSIVRIIGSGITEQSPHDYLGPSGGFFNLTDEGVAVGKLNAEYDVDIRLGLGGDINIQLATITEVLAAGSMTVGLQFDDNEPTQGNSMSDVLSAVQPTAADAFQNLGTLVVPSGEGGKAPSKIKKITIAIGLDQGIAAFSLRHALSIRITGSGLKGGGLHEFVGPHGDSGIVVIGGSAFEDTKIVLDADLEVNPAGNLVIDAILINELPTASTVGVGVSYE